MQRLRSVLGYVLAALALPIVLATFVAMPQIEHALVAMTGVTVSPWYTGGDVARRTPLGRYEMVVHRPVFQALVGEYDRGFIQLDFAPADSLPAVVDEPVDYDFDGAADLRLHLDTGAAAATIEPLEADVLGLRSVVRLDDGIAVRVDVMNPRKAGCPV